MVRNWFKSREILLTLVVFAASLGLIVSLLLFPELLSTKEFREGTTLETNVVAENNLVLINYQKTEQNRQKLLENAGLVFNLTENQASQAEKKLQGVQKVLAAAYAEQRRIEKSFDAAYHTRYAQNVYKFFLEQQEESFTAIEDSLKKGALEIAPLENMPRLPENEPQNYSELLQAARETKRQVDLVFKKSAAELEKSYGLALNEWEFGALVQLFRSKAFETQLKSLLSFFYQRPFIVDKQEFAGKLNYHVIVYTQNAERMPFGTLADIPDLASLYRSAVKNILRIELTDLEASAVQKLLRGIAEPSLTYNPSATDQNLASLPDTAAEEKVVLRKGQILAEKGELLTKEKAYLLNEYSTLNAKINPWPKRAGLIGLVFLWLLSLFLLLRQRPFRAIDRFRRWQFLRMGFIFLNLQFIISYLVVLFATPFFQLYSPEVLAALPLLFPVTLSAMFSILLIKRDVALFLASISGLLTLLLLDTNFMLGAFYIFGAPLVTIYIQPLKKVSSRSQILVFGLRAIIFNALIACLAGLFSYSSYFSGIPYQLLSLWISFSVIGSLFSVFLIISSLPILEQIFDIKTDIKLLELSSSNNPVLLELMKKAPGSYHHSIAVGSLAEAGAMKIGANTLFCRVASYYHDIGKIVNPGYFVENMDISNNPHTRLNDPIRSTKIIIEHVEDGVKLAKKHGLGKEIIDVIREHHGTSLVRYFYSKYLEKKALGEVPEGLTEKDFRYSGPKPQSVESALIMIADVCEASCRSLGNPSAKQIINVVKAVSNYILEDGQLDESLISLKDFKNIQEVYIDLLKAQYHQRVPYPTLSAGPQDGAPRILSFPKRS